MAKSAYPTGVENHGGTLRIWFIYKGARVRENLGVPDTPTNRKIAGELRASVCFSIKTGNFNYAAQFPDSPNLKKFGVESKEITVLELANKWLELKRMEISTNAMSRYSSIVRNMVPRIGGDKLVSAVTQEDLLFIRKELLTGYHVLKTGQKTPIKGRSVRTVNNYMRTISGMFNFAADSGYVKANPFNGISMLKRSRTEPDPLTREEFVRLINACTFVFNPQIVSRNGRAGHHYAVGSINQSWEAAMRRAGIRYRKAYQSRHTYECWSLAAGANPNFIAKQMGHTDAQMVYRVYGSWMAENNQDQVLILNQKLSEFAPSMPHAVGSDGY